MNILKNLLPQPELKPNTSLLTFLGRASNLITKACSDIYLIIDKCRTLIHVNQTRVIKMD